MTPLVPRPIRLLVIADEAAIRAPITRVLKRDGYDVTGASNGLDALMLADPPGWFDLILVNLQMPGMRGDDLVRRLREREPALKALFLIGFSDRMYRDRI